MVGGRERVLGGEGGGGIALAQLYGINPICTRVPHVGLNKLIIINNNNHRRLWLGCGSWCGRPKTGC